MLSLPPSVQIFVASEATDMRCSFDGLSTLVADVLEENPLSGHLFVFRNRRGDRVKILYWDRSGYRLWYKRLEKGVFRFPASTESCVELEAAELALILEGIDLAGATHRKRFKIGRAQDQKVVYKDSLFV